MNEKPRTEISKRFIFLPCLLMVSLCLYGGFAHAQHEFEIRPSISVSETYDDNIFLDPDDEESDYITAVSPSVTLSYLTELTQLDLTYAPSFVWYADEPDYNTVRHSGTLAFGQALTEHTKLQLSDTVIRSEEPLEETEDIEGVRRTREEYWRNNGNASLNYQFGPEDSISVGYGHSYLQNDDETVDDGTIQTPSANLAYWFNVKNGLELNYNYVSANFYNDDPNAEAGDDYTGHGGGARYIRRFEPHSNGYIRYNYITRDFDGLEEDYDVHEGLIGFERAFSPTLSISAGVGYFLQNSEDSDDESGLTYNASLVKSFERGSFTLGGAGGYDEAYLEAERRGFTRFWSANASLNYQLLEPLTGYVGGSYRRDEDEDSRQYYTVHGNAGLAWTFFRWFSLGLDYTYAERNDNVDEDDYKVNRIMLSLSASKLFRL